MPDWLATLSFSGGSLATFLKAVPSTRTRSAARGANKAKCSVGHIDAKNLSFCAYSWTLVVPGMNFGMLCQGGCGATLATDPPISGSSESGRGTPIPPPCPSAAVGGIALATDQNWQKKICKRIVGPWIGTLTVITGTGALVAPLPVWKVVDLAHWQLHPRSTLWSGINPVDLKDKLNTQRKRSDSQSEMMNGSLSNLKSM